MNPSVATKISMVLYSFSKALFFVCLTLILFCGTLEYAVAQAGALDFEAPVIDHDPLDYSTEGVTQVFSAVVSDNGEILSVDLFYRFTGQEEYSKISMKPVLDSSSYSASLSIKDTPESNIEYYIKAEDGAGNEVFEGLVFAPFVRVLDRFNSGISGTETGSNTQSTSTKNSVKPTSRVVYFVLGALAVGALIGLSDDGTTSPPNPCPDSGCTVTFSIERPPVEAR